MPKPTRISKNFYSKEYFTRAASPGKGKYGKRAFDLNNPFHIKMSAMILDVLPIKKGDSILDVGCALGNVVYWLAYDGINAYGIDIAEYAISHSHIKEKVKQGDVIDGLPYKKNRFDFIYSRETLEHIDRYYVPGILDEMYRVLKPGGCGLISTRNNFADKEVIKQGNPHSADCSHLCVEPPYWWAIVAERSGFKVDYRRTLYGMCLPLCELNTWTMLVIRKPK
ncbi:hypothetical protein LCGC14_0667380 [marine sediment metagenome]|uniref:Methyltransferase type 11 domain-containing protein n=1 Tax=marine sediment metagenome TaxID=412755 RepID=A0A0F9U034_9ZZZZ